MKKLPLWLIVLFSWQVSFAALRGTASTVNTSTGTSVTVDLTGISGLADGDVLVCAINGGGNSGASTFTFPAGFSAISGLTQQNIGNSTAFAVEYEVVSGTPPTSVTITSTGNDFQTAQCRDYFGRSGTVDAEALTAVTAVGSNPQSFNGLTGTSGDDLVMFAAVENSNDGYGYVFSTPTGFANPLNTGPSGSASYETYVASFDYVAYGGGATGTISSSYTATSSPAPNYAGFLLALAASGGSSCTHDGITSAGALAVPNGTSGSYQGKTGDFVTPDCSTVNYKQPTVGNFGTN